VDGPCLVSREVVNFFSNHLANHEWRCPTLDGITFLVLEVEKIEALTANFSLEEIT
jgi:hypothetical protein